MSAQSQPFPPASAANAPPAPPGGEAQPTDEELIVQSKRGVRIFLSANVIAFALAAAIFASVWYAEPVTFAFSAAWDWLAENVGWAVAAAISPLFASMLVGYGYMRRAMARRAKEEEAARRRAAAAADERAPAGPATAGTA